MKLYQNKTLPVCLFFLFALGILLVSLFSDTASAQPACGVTTCKSAPQLPPAESEEDLVFFPFVEIRGGHRNEFTVAANSRCSGAGLNTGESNVTIEEPLEGWQLVDIECDSVPGVSTEIFQNGVTTHCLSEGFITCTFTNVQAVSNIPTLSEWGMIAAAGGLMIVGVFFALRRKRAQVV
jgi:hypothetical protein